MHPAGPSMKADTTHVLAEGWALGREDNGQPQPGAAAVLQNPLGRVRSGRTAFHRTVDIAPSTGGACSG